MFLRFPSILLILPRPRTQYVCVFLLPEQSAWPDNRPEHQPSLHMGGRWGCSRLSYLCIRSVRQGLSHAFPHLSKYPSINVRQIIVEMKCWWNSWYKFAFSWEYRDKKLKVADTNESLTTLILNIRYFLNQLLKKTVLFNNIKVN